MNNMRILPSKGFDYINTGNPTVSVNPPVALVTWLNAVTGQIWVCVDNTAGANIWKSQGPIISEKESFTPSVSGTTNVTWTGQKWRIGNLLYLEINGLLTGNLTGNPVVTLPDGLLFDLSIITGEINRLFGSGTLREVGVYVFPIMGRSVNSTTFQLLSFTDVLTAQENMSPINGSFPSTTLASDDVITFFAAIPIAGWNVGTIS